MRYTIPILLICLVQATVLNHIHLFHCMTPMLIIYPLLFIERDAAPWALLLTGFGIGVVADMFTNTPGMAAASLTAVAMARPYVFKLCSQHDEENNIMPTSKQMGLSSYLLYAAMLTGGFCLVYFTLEAFTFFHFWRWVGCIAGSTVFTLVLIMAIESVRKA